MPPPVPPGSPDGLLVVGELDGELGADVLPDVAVTAAGTGAEGIAALRRPPGPDGGPAIGAVVVALPLPDLDPAEVVGALRAADPEVPVLVAVAAEHLDASADALDALDLFAVLVRPVPPVVLSTAVRAALRHRAAVTAERLVLQETLTGVVDVLIETLAVASPLAYSRTGRVRLMTDRVTERLGLVDDWQLRLAAMVSQIGSFAVPHVVLAKVEDTERLSPVERQMHVGSLTLASRLLAQVPRLGDVATWVGGQYLDIEDLRPGRPGRLPRACFDAVAVFLAGYDAGLAPGEIVHLMTASGRYPAEVVDAVREAADVLTPKGVPESLTVDQIRVGMVLGGDVTTHNGMLLLRRGERVTDVIEHRLRNFAHSVGVVEPIAVVLPGRRPPTAGRAGVRRDPARGAGAAPSTPA